MTLRILRYACAVLAQSIAELLPATLTCTYSKVLLLRLGHVVHKRSDVILSCEKVEVDGHLDSQLGPCQLCPKRVENLPLSVDVRKIHEHRGVSCRETIRLRQGLVSKRRPKQDGRFQPPLRLLGLTTQAMRIVRRRRSCTTYTPSPGQVARPRCTLNNHSYGCQTRHSMYALERGWDGQV